MRLADASVGPVIDEIVRGEYWGRVPIVGRKGDSDVVAYFPSGRSTGSKARFLHLEDDGQSIVVEPSVDAEPGNGNPALIYYNAIQLLSDGGIVVTNGAQTDLIVQTYQQLRERGENPDPQELLKKAFDVPHMMNNFDPETNTMTRIDITRFEPDAPNYTPRTSLVLGMGQAAMCIATHTEGGKADKTFYRVILDDDNDDNGDSMPGFTVLAKDGFARALPTYTGQNVPSGAIIPHYVGEPMEIPIVGDTAEEFAIALYNSLGPKAEEIGVVSPGADFRVGVAAIFRDRATGTLDYHVINAHEHAPEELRAKCMGK